VLDLDDVAARLNQGSINPAPTRIWPTVCLTGHRPQHLSPAARAWLPGELARIVARLRDENGTTTGVSGMALGADMWWAEAVLAAGLKLWAHVPCPQQADRWSAADRRQWERLLQQAWKVTLYGDAYSVDLFGERDEGMVKVSDAAVAVWNPAKRRTGTFKTLRFAVEHGLPVVHVNPDTLRTTMPGPQAWRQALAR